MNKKQKKDKITCNGIDRVLFTEEMRKDYTILFPTMLPRHFKIISKVFNHYGYNTVLLEDGTHGDEKAVIDAGLRSVHNDACYPALLVIGQFIHALESGKYDTHKVALMMSQTGGGCRASNYIALIRKALKKAGFEYVPVISLNFSGLEKNPGFKITLPMAHRAIYAVLYGDLLMTLVNQTKPYETVKGSSEKLADEWTDRLVQEMTNSRIKYSAVKKNYDLIVKDFANIERTSEKKVKVGIVGEIFVKFSPLGNNNLEEFLISENAEPVMAGLMDFVMYCAYNPIKDAELYGKGKKTAWIYKIVCKFAAKKQNDMFDAIRRSGIFNTPASFDSTVHAANDYISNGVKMGEGWLLTAEMLELIEEGVNNIVCAQPFGCLPNHIVGKGMMKPIKETHPNVNIVAIDYDPGATKINQENRIKLMLANANEALMAELDNA
ncbi:MAG: 2-hydroxyglutaryl-CoA dehydratase [Ruminococcaceae bacterium]|nr:2-hydroxyglutaryl-CoA dehydratase [Oscillospiraceae bacterium]